MKSVLISIQPYCPKCDSEMKIVWNWFKKPRQPYKYVCKNCGMVVYYKEIKGD